MSDVRVIDTGDGWRVLVLREGVWGCVARRESPFAACAIARKWGW